MKCGYSEESLALFLESDLPESQAHALEGHLKECGDCQAAYERLRETMDVFKDWRSCSVDASDLSDLQTRVRETMASGAAVPGFALQVERALYAGFRRKWVLAGAGTAGLLAVLLGGQLLWKSPEIHSVPAAADSSVGEKTVPAAPVVKSDIVLAPVQEVVNPKVVSANLARPRQEAHEEAGPPAPTSEPREIAMKLFTDDPNIVIYWFVEEKGATE